MFDIWNQSIDIVEEIYNKDRHVEKSNAYPFVKIEEQHWRRN